MATDDLRAFIEARLAEDEQWARAASQPYKYASEHSKPPEGGVHWTWVVGENWTPVTADPVADDTVGGEEHYGCTVNLASVEEWPTDASDHGWPVRTMPRTVANSMVEVDSSAAGHIARHDPARVLREVAAKRALIAEHNIPAIVWADDPYYAAGHGSAPRRCVGCGFNSVEEVLIEDIENCPVLRALASVWSDHPDFRAEWSTA